MSQVRTHGRRFIEPIRRKIRKDSQHRSSKHQQHVDHNGFLMPRLSLETLIQSEYDSDSEGSEACSELWSEAESHDTKDSGYNSSISTPASTPGQINYLRLSETEELEIGKSLKAPSAVLEFKSGDGRGRSFIVGLLDHGSRYSVVARQVVERFGHLGHVREDNLPALRSIGGNLTPAGSIWLSYRVNDSKKVFRTKFYIVGDSVLSASRANFEALLGAQTITRLTKHNAIGVGQHLTSIKPIFFRSGSIQSDLGNVQRVTVQHEHSTLPKLVSEVGSLSLETKATRRIETSMGPELSTPAKSHGLFKKDEASLSEATDYVCALDTKPSTAEETRASKPSVGANRKPGGGGPMKRHLQRFKVWHRLTDNGGPFADRSALASFTGNDRRGVHTEELTKKPTAGTDTMTEISLKLATESISRRDYRSREPPPATTEAPLITPSESSTEDAGFVSPPVPPELSVAVAMLEIEHTNSHSSSSLSRTLNSSRTLNTLSEGEISFVGMDESCVHDVELDHSIDRVTVEFLEELAGRIVDRCLRMADYGGSRLHTGHQSGSSSSTSSSTSTRSTQDVSPITSATSTPARSGCAAKPSQNGEDEDGDTRRWRSRKRKRSDAVPVVRLFACPYSKFDPVRYSRENLGEPGYWNCGSCCLRDISRLKQHLYRVHSRPSYYCGSCFESFKTRDDLDSHARQRPPCELSNPRYADMMTDNQFQAIKRRVIGGEPYDLWFRIFQTLFPGAPKPPSPYVSVADAATVNHFVTLFRWIGPEEMMSMLSARQGQPGQAELDLSTQTVVDEAFEIAWPEYLEQQRPSHLFAASTGFEVQRPSEALDDDGLTMAPYGRVPQNGGAIYQPSTSQSEPPGFEIEAVVEDSTPRAVVLPSSLALEDSIVPRSQPTFFQRWPDYGTAQSQVQTAFNSYAPFNFATLHPMQWTMQELQANLGDAQETDAAALVDNTYQWTSREMC